jgi:hypothetical protein
MKHPCSQCGKTHNAKEMRYSHFLTIGPGPSEEWLCRGCAAAQDIRQEMLEVVGKIHCLKIDYRYDRRYDKLIRKYRMLEKKLEALGV